jgi:hypothetical protein
VPIEHVVGFDADAGRCIDIENTGAPGSLRTPPSSSPPPGHGEVAMWAWVVRAPAPSALARRAGRAPSSRVARGQ